MYTFAIIISLIGLIGFLVGLYMLFTSMSDQTMTIAIILLIVCVIIGFAGLYMMIVTRPATTETLELVAMYSDTEINANGHSVLGTGRFVAKENGAYRYYYRGNDGGIRQGSADAEDSVIYEINDPEITPHVVVTKSGTGESYQFYVPANEWAYQLN